MPQNDDAPKVMPDLGALSLADVEFYVRFFNQLALMMDQARAVDPACNPVAVISPGLSPCIELTGLQWPQEFVVEGPQMDVAAGLQVEIDRSKFLLPPAGAEQLDITKSALWDFRPTTEAGADHSGDAIPYHCAAQAEPPAERATPPLAGAPAAGDAPPPQPPQARTPAAGTNENAAKEQKPAKWTETEDLQLVNMMASELAHGATYRVAADHAAAVLGRPTEGTLFRCYSKLKPHIEAALAELRAASQPATIHETPPSQKQTAPVTQVGAGDALAAEVAAPAKASDQAGAVAAAPAKYTPLTPLGQAVEWLQELAARKDQTPFTVQKDHDLLHFANLGWPLHEVAPEIGYTVEQCKTRHSALTKMKRLRTADASAALLFLHPELEENAA